MPNPPLPAHPWPQRWASSLCGLAIATAAGLTTPTHAQTTPDPVQRTTYIYKSLPTLDLKADVYDPPIAQWGTQRPVIVFIHGGGWTCGNRDAFGDWPRYIAATYGLVTVTAEYRLAPITDAVVKDNQIVSPGAQDGCSAGSFPADGLGLPANRAAYPAQLDDLQDLMLQLRRYAAFLRINPRKIAVLGASAGGQLAGMLGAVNRRVPNIELGQLYSRADAVISISGPWDLSDSTAFTNPAAPGIVRNLFNGPPTPAQLQSASPGLQWAPGGGSAPVLFIHGAEDNLVPVSQSLNACARIATCAGGQPLVIKPPSGVDPHDGLFLLQRGFDTVVGFMGAFIAAP